MKTFVFNGGHLGRQFGPSQQQSIFWMSMLMIKICVYVFTWTKQMGLANIKSNMTI